MSMTDANFLETTARLQSELTALGRQFVENPLENKRQAAQLFFGALDKAADIACVLHAHTQHNPLHTKDNLQKLFVASQIVGMIFGANKFNDWNTSLTDTDQKLTADQLNFSAREFIDAQKKDQEAGEIQATIDLFRN